ncbi:MAG: response regulator transcription factor [Solirubrobacterales bacterium]
MKVLIAEDDPKIVQLIKLYLEKEQYEVITAATGAQAVTRFETESPDMVILDLMMPALSGIEVLKAIRRSHQTPVIILTAKDDEVDKILGLEIGADDYVTKPFSPRELVARVKSLWRRVQTPQQPTGERLAFAGLTLELGRREVVSDGHPVHLTPREYDLLVLLAQAQGRPFGRDLLLERVWGYDFPGDDRTVDVHIKRLRQKLENNGYSYIQTVWGVGYKFEVRAKEHA